MVDYFKTFSASVWADPGNLESKGPNVIAYILGPKTIFQLEITYQF
jgi:hypothetical protein